MKWVTVGLVVACMLLGPFVPAATAVQTAVLQVQVATNPALSLPGTSGSIVLTIKNVGNASTTRTEFRLDHADAGIIVTPDKLVTIGAVAAGATTTVTPFSFEVPSSTAPGYYKATFVLTLLYSDGTTSRTDALSFTATIAVRASPALVIQTVSPNQLLPGQVSTINITLVNQGAAPFSNLIAKWSAPGDAILPLGGTNEFQIEQIAARDELVVPIQVASASGTAPGLYPLTFQLKYNDAAGTSFDTSSVVGLVLGGATTLSVAVEDVDEDIATLVISNVGVNPVTGVELKLIPGSGAKLTGGDTFAFGLLQAGGSATASFNLERTGRRTDGAEATILLSYTDSVGERRNQTSTINIGNLGNPLEPITIVAITAGVILGAQLIAFLLAHGIRRKMAKRRDQDEAMSAALGETDRLSRALHELEEKKARSDPNLLRTGGSKRD